MPISNPNVARHLADNVVRLRRAKRMSQSELARLAGIPRSTLTYMESGSGNPSLKNLAGISSALQVGLEELLSRPRNDCELRAESEIPLQRRSQGRALIYKLLPEKVRGLEVDRMELERGAIMGGLPHLAGAKEYLTVLQGEITVGVAGENFVVKRGAVLAFPGDQPHAYRNTGPSRAVAISVIVPVTLAVD